MFKIEAQILYDQIREADSGSGLYVWADPDEQSILSLGNFLSGAPFKPNHSTDFHVTVLYHKHDLPFGVKPPADRVCKGSVTSLQVWLDHKQRPVLVAYLDSPDLQRLHSELLGEGLQHSFPDYRAHLTLSYDAPNTAQLRLWVEQKNTELAADPLPLSFGPQLKAEATN
jgi:hypothetical protein